MNKLRLPVLIAVIIIQLLTPVYMIANKYNILNTGEEYLFKVQPLDPYDAFRGRYVLLNARQEVMGDGRYGVITVGADGYAKIASITNDKPISGAYVKSASRNRFDMPIDRYYMDEKLAPEAELLTRQRDTGQEAYVAVRVKNGDLVISGLYIDGVPIETIIRASMQ